MPRGLIRFADGMDQASDADASAIAEWESTRASEGSANLDRWLTTNRRTYNRSGFLDYREDAAPQAGVPRTRADVWGSDNKGLRKTYEMDGYTVVPEASRAGTSGNARILRIDKHPTIKKVQYSPESEYSEHKGQLQIFRHGQKVTKIIDPVTYKQHKDERDVNFLDQEGNPILWNDELKAWVPR